MRFRVCSIHTFFGTVSTRSVNIGLTMWEIVLVLYYTFLNIVYKGFFL